MRYDDSTLSLSTPIGHKFNEEGLLVFLNDETDGGYVESPVLRYLFSVFSHLEQRGMTSNGDLYFCNMQNGQLYVLRRNGWAHNFNRWFNRQKVVNQVGYVMRDACIAYLKKQAKKSGTIIA